MSITPKESIAKSPSGRVKRTRVGTARYLPEVEKDTEYEYRYVNDRDDRIHQFKQAGWEPAPASSIHVNDVAGDRTSSLGSMAQVSVGNGDKAILMRLPKDLYAQDQAEKQAIVDRSDQAMKDDMRRTADFGKYGKDTNIS
jgi:hypothetical protein